jgi:AraC-like DNA-binding protein
MDGLYLDKSTKKKRAGLFTSHFHDHYEIYYLSRGQMRYIIADKIYSVSRGDIVLIPKGVIHNTSYDEEDTERLLINFDDSFVSEKELLRCFDKKIIRTSDSIRAEFEYLFKKLGREEREGDRYSKALVAQYINELLILFNRCDEKAADDTLGGYSKIMQNAVDYINDNYQSELSLDILCEKYALSRSFFSRKFKEVTGFGVCEYITLIRIKNAEKMLTEGNCSVTETAFACGFNDSSYFAAIFKKLIGITPKKYSVTKSDQSSLSDVR